jgi:hypothetical protein
MLKHFPNFFNCLSLLCAIMPIASISAISAEIEPLHLAQKPSNCEAITANAQFVTRGGFIYVDYLSNEKYVWNSSNCKNVGALNASMYLDRSFVPCDPNMAHPSTLAGLLAQNSVSPPVCIEGYYKIEERSVDGLTVQLLKLVSRDARAVVKAKWQGGSEPDWSTQLVGISRNACQRVDCRQFQ